MYYVYIIFNDQYDKYYVGQTSDLDRRIFEHNNKLTVYTSKYDGVWELKYKEKFETRSGAMLREKFLKKQKNKDFYKGLIGAHSSAG